MALTTDLEAYYSFDNDSISAPTVYDLTANDIDGTMVNTPTTGAVGLLGEAIDFERGSSEYIDFGNNMNLSGEFSFSVWFKIEAFVSSLFLVSKGNQGTGVGGVYYMFTDTTQKLRFGMYSAAEGWDTISGTTNLGVETWYHGVVTRNSSNLVTLYLDGDSENTMSAPHAMSNSRDVYIGAGDNNGSPYNFWDGEIDEFGYWSRCLTSAEVTELYNSGSGLAYPFTTGTNTQVNIGDAWKDISAVQINIGDSWKAVAGMQVNIGDAWKTIF